jgi:hypothetical protein
VEQCRESALTRFETWIALADHENLAAAAHDLAVAVAGLGGFERGQDFHGDKPYAAVMGSRAL